MIALQVTYSRPIYGGSRETVYSMPEEVSSVVSGEAMSHSRETVATLTEEASSFFGSQDKVSLVSESGTVVEVIRIPVRYRKVLGWISPDDSEIGGTLNFEARIPEFVITGGKASVSSSAA